ncbi:MAG: 30S ribosomal protein S15 [Chloroflexi bacterium]|nr:30S ribosomal protein S15 [Chloroflexota bacterium]
MDKEKKAELIQKFAQTEKDVGSTEIQVALMTEQIKHLTEHMSANRKDFVSQLTLMKLVGKRRRFLAYLSRENVHRYNQLIGRLGLRK